MVWIRSAVLRISLLMITFAVATVVSVVPAYTSAPQSGKVFKLFILNSQRGAPYDEICASLVSALARQGYTEGKNLQIVMKYSDNDIKRGEQILHGEQKNSYDVIFVAGSPATLSAKNVLERQPQRVVFASVTDPVGIGVIRDFSSKPAGNFTGVSYPVPVKTRLKFVRRLMPKAKTFGLIYADMPQSHSYNKWLEHLLKSDPEFKDVRIMFRQVPLVTGKNGDKEMAALSKKQIQDIDSKVDAYIAPCDQLAARRLFSEAVYNTSKKPLIGLVKDDVMGKWGAMAAIYPAHESIGSQSARMIQELFEGKKISEIIPEWPHRFGVAIDLHKAKQFGIDVPVELLQMAGENIVR